MHQVTLIPVHAVHTGLLGHMIDNIVWYSPQLLIISLAAITFLASIRVLGRLIIKHGRKYYAAHSSHR